MSQPALQDAVPVFSQTTLVVHLLDVPQPVADLLRGMLSQLGFPCLATANPRKSLEQIGRAQPGQCNVILCDTGLPGIASRKFVAQALRRDPDAFIIVMAASGSEESAAAALPSGAYAWLAKPIDRARLGEALDEVAEQFQRRLRIRSMQASLTDELAAFYETKCNRLYSKRIEGLTPDARAALLDRVWQGNTHNMESLIAAAMRAATANFIDVEHLPAYPDASVSAPASGELTPALSVSAAHARSMNHPLSMKNVRLEHIHRVLDLCDGNRVRAAQLLGIGRTSLYRYLKRDANKLQCAATASAVAAAQLGGLR